MLQSLLSHDFFAEVSKCVAAEILSSGRKQELVASAAEPTQPEPVELEDPLDAAEPPQ